MSGMATFEKDILYPGTVAPPDLDGPVTFTTEHAPEGVTPDGKISVPFLAARMKEMLGDDLQIPLSWEHQPAAKPLTKRERDEQQAELAKLTLGHVTAAELRPEGFAAAKVEIPVDEDAKRLRAIRFVSPAIDWDVTDGNGRFWPGPSITHLAATPRPVQHKQQPFRPVKLSQAATPQRPAIRLSLGSYIQLGENPMADDAKKDGDDKGKKGDDGAIVEPGVKLSKVVACLGELGLVLGDGVTPENLLERLYVAAETKKAADGVTTDTSAGTGTETETDAQPPPGIMMSLQTRILKMERQDLERRIKALRDTGRVGKPIYDRMAAELKSIKLSLGKDGEVADNLLLSKVKDYEALPEGSAWPLGRPIHLSEQEVELDPPDGSPVSDEEALQQIGEVWGTRRRARA